jgi:hypothetical protein
MNVGMYAKRKMDIKQNRTRFLVKVPRSTLYPVSSDICKAIQRPHSTKPSVVNLQLCFVAQPLKSVPYQP